MMSFRVLLTILSLGLIALACDDGSDGRILGNGDADTDGDSDSDADGDADGDSDVDTTGGSCENTLSAIYRDFKSTHADFERLDLGWGPCQGMIKPDIGPDRKPVFNLLNGEFQVVDPNCGATCPNGGFLSNASLVPIAEPWGSVPMWEGATTFDQWYRDVDGVNMRIEKNIRLEPSGNGSFVYDDDTFFPIGNDEGFGAESGMIDQYGDLRNFLFTTEIHFEFKYVGGEVFTFRGDDDLWIFVNDKLALDLGGLHWPYEGTIDFDTQATELGIQPGNDYKMDIFHAERHTSQSNFRIETNIACFVTIIE